MILGIDTSNYTTSLALTENCYIKEKRQILEVKTGERGLRQSDAVFLHNRNLPKLFEEIYDNEKIDAVGVSYAPRSNKDSYMPCFTVGLGYAKVLSKILNVPLYEFSHQQGHIMAAVSSIGMEKFLDDEFIAFHISGGTSEILKVSSWKNDFFVEIIGSTLDLNIGQAVDRIGLKLGLDFPCGKSLEHLAEAGNINFNPKISVDGFNFNISGMENMALSLISKGYKKEDIAVFVYYFIIKTLETVLQNVLKKYKKFPIIFSGGVMSSNIISSYFKNKYECYFAKPNFSSDNAYGIAKLAERKFYEYRT